MARYYVEKDGEWNIFSTIIDDFIFDEFICLDALKARLLYERFKELTEDMDSLLTDNPRVNVMTYSEAIERKQADTPQTDMDEDIVRSYGFKVESYRQAKAKDEPQTDCGWKRGEVMLKSLLGLGLVLMVWSAVALVGLLRYYLWSTRDTWK